MNNRKDQANAPGGLADQPEQKGQSPNVVKQSANLMAFKSKLKNHVSEGKVLGENSSSSREQESLMKSDNPEHSVLQHSHHSGLHHSGLQNSVSTNGRYDFLIMSGSGGKAASKISMSGLESYLLLEQSRATDLYKLGQSKLDTTAKNENIIISGQLPDESASLSSGIVNQSPVLRGLGFSAPSQKDQLHGPSEFGPVSNRLVADDSKSRGASHASPFSLTRALDQRTDSQSQLQEGQLNDMATEGKPSNISFNFNVKESNPLRHSYLKQSPLHTQQTIENSDFRLSESNNGDEEGPDKLPASYKQVGADISLKTKKEQEDQLKAQFLNSFLTTKSGHLQNSFQDPGLRQTNDERQHKKDFNSRIEVLKQILSNDQEQKPQSRALPEKQAQTTATKAIEFPPQAREVQNPEAQSHLPIDSCEPSDVIDGLIILKQFAGGPNSKESDPTFEFSEIIKNETTAERKPVAEGTGGSGTSEVTQEQNPPASKKSTMEAEHAPGGDKNLHSHFTSSIRNLINDSSEFLPLQTQGEEEEDDRVTAQQNRQKFKAHSKLHLTDSSKSKDFGEQSSIISYKFIHVNTQQQLSFAHSNSNSKNRRHREGSSTAMSQFVAGPDQQVPEDIHVKDDQIIQQLQAEINSKGDQPSARGKIGFSSSKKQGPSTSLLERPPSTGSLRKGRASIGSQGEGPRARSKRNFDFRQRSDSISFPGEEVDSMKSVGSNKNHAKVVNQQYASLKTLTVHGKKPQYVGSLTEIPHQNENAYTEDEEAFIMHMKLKETSDRGEELLNLDATGGDAPSGSPDSGSQPTEEAAQLDGQEHVDSLISSLQLDKEKLQRQYDTLNLEKQLERTEKLKYMHEASTLKAFISSDTFLFSRLQKLTEKMAEVRIDQPLGMEEQSQFSFVLKKVPAGQPLLLHKQTQTDSQGIPSTGIQTSFDQDLHISSISRESCSILGSDKNPYGSSKSVGKKFKIKLLKQKPAKVEMSEKESSDSSPMAYYFDQSTHMKTLKDRPSKGLDMQKATIFKFDQTIKNQTQVPMTTKAQPIDRQNFRVLDSDSNQAASTYLQTEKKEEGHKRVQSASSLSKKILAKSNSVKSLNLNLTLQKQQANVENEEFLKTIAQRRQLRKQLIEKTKTGMKPFSLSNFKSQAQIDQPPKQIVGSIQAPVAGAAKPDRLPEDEAHTLQEEEFKFLLQERHGEHRSQTYWHQPQPNRHPQSEEQVAKKLQPLASAQGGHIRSDNSGVHNLYYSTVQGLLPHESEDKDEISDL